MGQNWKGIITLKEKMKEFNVKNYNDIFGCKMESLIPGNSASLVL